MIFVKHISKDVKQQDISIVFQSYFLRCLGWHVFGVQSYLLTRCLEV